MVASGTGPAGDGYPFRKTGAWEDADIQTLIRLWGEGRSNLEIARELGRQENAVAIKASRLHLPPKATAAQKFAPANAKNAKAKLRPCLTCSKTFFSEGPGNRICEPCKSTSAWSGSDYVVQYGGRC
ncbi:GcrA family cell cycle regulator [Defluviimonas salinarum]|uniref:GcrA family cell cycle regulator n=1 Tax=Defluviimonas salinarum TaxID=2992147 RepID=A0ABT3J4L6_9RHOB|nr:GcrA family cell cycle regulator [Defluviimonas salinarum]MCW3782610.1 GcrA family cell cycle regulator [Defluviimonas salinarum]